MLQSIYDTGITKKLLPMLNSADQFDVQYPHIQGIFWLISSHNIPSFGDQ